MSGAAWVRKMVVGLGLGLACATLAPVPALAAEARPKTIYHKGKSFRVPFNVDKADRPRLKEIQLWVSDDQGLRWEFYAHVPPDQPAFGFQAPRDGEYWFTVRTKDTQGALHPADDKDVAVGLAVIVDTTPPTLTLQPRPRRGSQASVSWEMGDKYPNPASLVLEYQAEGAGDWRRVPNVRPGLLGVATWDAGTADALKVRAAVADRAGNRAIEELPLPDAVATDPGPAGEPSEVIEPPPILPASSSGRRGPGPDPAAAPPSLPTGSAPDLLPAEPGAEPEPTPAPSQAAGGEVATLLVGSPRFPLKYAVEDPGEGGPAVVELWVTHDKGRTWSVLARDPDRTSPFPVDVGGEGTFGLKLVARSASGLGDPPPAPGQAPDTWVVVDMTPPAVRLDPPRPDPETGKLRITWRATDAHLGARPVVLSYRPDRPDAIWQQITGPIPNSGHYDWALPANVAARFQIRIDVLDTLDNRGSDESAPVAVNRARPKGRIIGLDSSARAGGRSLK